MDAIATKPEIYYKIQNFDKNSLTWVDKQVAYKTLKDVQDNLPSSVKARIMVVDGKKRYPLNA